MVRHNSFVFRSCIIIICLFCSMQWGCVFSAVIITHAHPSQNDANEGQNEALSQNQLYVGRSREHSQSNVSTNLIAFLDALECQSSETLVWAESLDVCLWKKVQCNANGEVNAISLSSRNCKGRIDFTKLPSSLQTLWLFGNQLSGSIDLTQMPSSLQELWLYQNQLGGSVYLTRLPSSLHTLDLSSSQLSGSIDLTKLPSSLQILYLSGNQFSGSVDLTQLPPSLQYLSLSSNQLSGSIDLAHLPSSLRHLWLSKNSFSSVGANLNTCGLRVLSLWGNSWQCPLPAKPSCLASKMGTCGIPVQ